MPSKRNPMNVHGRIDELELDAKSVLRSFVKYCGTLVPDEVEIHVTTNDHFQTYKVTDIHVNGVDVIYETEGVPTAYGFFGWSSLMPYTIFTVVKQLYLADVIKITGK